MFVTAEFSTEVATADISIVSAFIDTHAFGVPLGAFGAVTEDGTVYAFGVIEEYQ